MARARRLRLVKGADGEGGTERPIVRLLQGSRPVAVHEVEQHLAARDSAIYQRGLFLVRIVQEEIELPGGERVVMLRTLKIGSEFLRLRVNQSCDTRKFDKRADAWISVDCPRDMAAAILDRAGEWPFPRVGFLRSAPALRPDGSIVTRPGYDEATRIYYDPRGVAFPPVPPSPTRAQALAALDKFDCLLGTLDLVDDLARSAAISAIWTALFRTAMSAAPMHGVTAPVPGSGKSKIVLIAAMLAIGHPVPVLTLADREEETEKRIASMLMASQPLISIDNAERPIGGQFLNQVITEPLVAPRMLGTNDMVFLANTAAWYATGNNLKFSGDVAARRTLMVRLDPQCERPELREFEAPDPVVVAREQRGELVCAALTIVRAFVAAGMPRSRAPISPFEDWCRWVRDVLIWLGRPDPVEAMGEARRDDPVLAALVAVVEQWHRVLCDRRVTTREVIAEADRQGSYGDYLHPELRDALRNIAGDSGNSISGARLGRWLGRMKGRAVGGRRIVEAELIDGVRRWKVETLSSGSGFSGESTLS